MRGEAWSDQKARDPHSFEAILRGRFWAFAYCGKIFWFKWYLLQAYDEEGNIFNTLEGFRFEWNIDTGTDIVKIVTTKEAQHKQSEIKREMEFSKLHSDVLFLKGLRTGTA